MPPAPSLDTGRIDAGPALQATRDACFHCGQPVAPPGRWLARVDGEDRDDVLRRLPGGRAGDRRRRTRRLLPPPRAPGRGARGGAAGTRATARLTTTRRCSSASCATAAQCLETTLLLDGLRCGACVWLIERSLGALPGVTAASVNFATERAVVRWDPARTRLSELLSRIAAVGYRAMPFDAQRREAQLARATSARCSGGCSSPASA